MSSYNFIEIGKRIKEERENLNLSQTELAKAVYVQRQTIASWESAKTFPQLADMLHLCNKFECELAYLLCENDCKTKDIQGIHDYTGLSEESIKKLSSIEIKGLPESWVKAVISEIILSPNFENLIASFFVQIFNTDNIAEKIKSPEKFMPELESDVNNLRFGKYDIAEACTKILYDIRPVEKIVNEASAAIAEYYSVIDKDFDSIHRS